MAGWQDGGGAERQLYRPVRAGVFKRAGIQPSAYLNQNIEVITSNFRAGKLDAAVMWEPTNIAPGPGRGWRARSPPALR
jgi:hypothetical protein